MDLIDKRFTKGGMLEKASIEDGNLHLQTFQDIEPNVEMVKAMRKDSDYTARGIKREFAHSLHISEVHVVALLNAGVNVYTAPTKDIVAGLVRLDLLEACRVTDKKLWRG